MILPNQNFVEKLKWVPVLLYRRATAMLSDRNDIETEYMKLLECWMEERRTVGLIVARWPKMAAVFN